MYNKSNLTHRRRINQVDLVDSAECPICGQHEHTLYYIDGMTPLCPECFCNSISGQFLLSEILIFSLN